MTNYIDTIGTIELTFKAWHKDRKQFFDVASIDCLESLVWVKEYIIWENEPRYEEVISGDKFDLSSVILLPYTGLNDKNGNNFYHGYIAKLYAPYHDYQDGIAISEIPDYIIDVIRFEDGAFWFGNELLAEVADELELIGNIFEHSHLLTPSTNDSI